VIVREFTGVRITQSALTQDALKKAEGVIGNACQELRAGVATAPAVYTDDTGWRIHGEGAQLMTFDTDRATVFQIRRQHRNEEVRELIPAGYAGVMVTGRGRSYEAEQLLGVRQQKCLDHPNRNIDEVLETKTGRARGFGRKLKGLLKKARQLWRDQRAGKAPNFQAHAERIEEKITDHLRQRCLKDGDNQRLLDGIGLQHDRGNLLRFLHEPHVEPTNNRGERALRPAVIARGLPHGSKNGRGAEAFAAFTSVLQTAVKNRVSSTIDTLHNLFRSNSKPRDAPVPP
jgi:transposase